MNTIKIVDLNNPNEVVLDWKKCFLCQKSTDITRVKLISPGKILFKKSDDDGYTSLAKRLIQFNGIITLPPKLKCFIEQHENVKDVLAKNSAKWHKKCYNTYSNEKLAKAIARKNDMSTTTPSETTTSNEITFDTPSPSSFDAPTCFEASPWINNLENLPYTSWETISPDCNMTPSSSSGCDRTSSSSPGCVMTPSPSPGCDMTPSPGCDRTSSPSPCCDMTPSPSSCWSSSPCIHGLKSEVCDIKLTNDPGEVLAKMADDIIEKKAIESGIIVFKLSELVRQYKEKLIESRIDCTGHSITSHTFKVKLLLAVPGLQAFKFRREVLLIFQVKINLA